MHYYSAGVCHSLHIRPVVVRECSNNAERRLSSLGLDRSLRHLRTHRIAIVGTGPLATLILKRLQVWKVLVVVKNREPLNVATIGRKLSTC